jgi:crotonobetainyl-CoA:carnitine CoA-transferase CaiB-like acyl-CoA transferase
MVADIVAEVDTATLTERLQAAEVPCGPIYTLDQAFNDPQARHMKLTDTITATDGKEITLPRQPFRLSRTPSKLARRTPEFAEHTDEVLTEFGFSETEIKGFRERGSVE